MEQGLERQEKENGGDDERSEEEWSSSNKDDFEQRLRTEAVKEHVNEIIREAVSDLTDQIMEYLHEEVPYFCV